LMNNNIARATISIEDSGKLERSRARLSRLEGVHSVGVNLLTQMISVEYDPGEISLEKIRTALKLAR
jgi:hypothetical protein